MSCQAGLHLRMVIKIRIQRLLGCGAVPAIQAETMDPPTDFPVRGFYRRSVKYWGQR